MSSFYSDMIYEKIVEAGNEAVFIATDFLDIADYETARKALNRLDSYGKIKKICRGVYYNPKFSELLGEYEAPSPHNVALALARKFNWNIAPSGNTALNQLGLSTQVTAHWTYISDGPYNKFTIGNIEIDFKHRSNKEISGIPKPSTKQQVRSLQLQPSEPSGKRLRFFITRQTVLKIWQCPNDIRDTTMIYTA